MNPSGADTCAQGAFGINQTVTKDGLYRTPISRSDPDSGPDCGLRPAACSRQRMISAKKGRRSSVIERKNKEVGGR